MTVRVWDITWVVQTAGVNALNFGTSYSGNICELPANDVCAFLVFQQQDDTDNILRWFAGLAVGVVHR